MNKFYKVVLQKIFLLFNILLLISLPTFASNTKTLKINVKDTDPQFLCLVASTYHEKKHNIPKNILKSMSIVESGRWNKEYKIQLAWPWVVGIDGKGKFFDTYQEAAKFLRHAVARGENVDIGCHQVNWKHHGHNFKTPEELLHPMKNADYAAQFLVNNFNSTKSWNKAISYYHSRTSNLGNVYLDKVQQTLYKMKGEKFNEYNNFIREKSSKAKYNNFFPKNNKAISQENAVLVNNISQKFHYGKQNNDIIMISEKADLLPVKN